jgi:hypothetical protein
VRPIWTYIFGPLRQRRPAPVGHPLSACVHPFHDRAQHNEPSRDDVRGLHADARRVVSSPHRPRRRVTRQAHLDPFGIKGVFGTAVAAAVAGVAVTVVVKRIL